MGGRSLSLLAVVIFLIAVSAYISLSGSTGLAISSPQTCKTMGERWSYEANYNMPPFDCCPGLWACTDGYCCDTGNSAGVVTGYITSRPAEGSDQPIPAGLSKVPVIAETPESDEEQAAEPESQTQETPPASLNEIKPSPVIMQLRYETAHVETQQPDEETGPEVPQTPDNPVEIACHRNSDCGANGWAGNAYCNSGDVWQRWRTYTCQNPGTEFSQCSYTDRGFKKQDCPNGCSSGSCSSNLVILDYACYNDSDCGTNGWLGQEYCTGNAGDNEDLADIYRTYKCNNPGTPSAYCTHTDEDMIKQDCGDTSYGEWSSPYCASGDVYHSRTITYRGCDVGGCYANTASDEEKLEECGNKNCVSGECVNNPPRIDSYSPTTNPTITLGQSQTFSITKSDPDGDPLTVNWYVDNQLRSEGQDSYTFTPSAAGTYEVRVTVSDGTDSVSHTWTLTVNPAGNNPPRIDSYSPPDSNPKIDLSQTQVFSITKSDPDGDPLTVRWYVDSQLKQQNTDSYSYTGLIPGNFEVKVTVSDGQATAEHIWTLTVNKPANRPPQINSYSPASNPTITLGQTQVFSITKSDPDGDPLTVNWYVDNQLRSEGQDSYTFTPSAAGTYEVRVTVSDGWESVSHTWTLTVTGGTEDLPDLRISGLRVMWPPNPKAGDTVSFEFVMKNIGNKKAESVGFRLLTGNSNWNSPQAIALETNEEIYVTYDYAYSQPGTYIVTAIADPDNSIRESNENNNQMSISVVIVSS